MGVQIDRNTFEVSAEEAIEILGFEPKHTKQSKYVLKTYNGFADLLWLQRKDARCKWHLAGTVTIYSLAW